MNQTQLNLARKWRSKNFDTIVGQELSVRMLKNSLYLNQYFPVYLFSGQRGCGKTTTARVFAAAVNCAVLSAFQKSPKSEVLPCGTCDSCVSMLAGKHPDFIEIDAASHTGVDNVRQIIEACTLLPLMGRKKIYLIDEAHMLSKAAFNAFLKILEEPPMSVLFILATTDSQKIIETVKSRCFQLFFTPINSQHLKNHLVSVCQAEGIEFEEEGLSVIVKESEGSARDALNLLEQVRFSAPIISKKNVLQALGQLTDEQLHALCDTVINKQAQDIIALLADLKFETYAAEQIYHALVEFLRSALWLKHGIHREAESDTHKLSSVITHVSARRLSAMLEALCSQELVFAKTTKKHLFLEMLLLSLSSQGEEGNKNSNVPFPPKNTSEKKSPLNNPVHKAVSENVELHKQAAPPIEPIKAEPEVSQPTAAQPQEWQTLLNQLQALNDPLLQSIFAQGIFEGFDSQKNTVSLGFSDKLIFFQDWLNDTKQLWKPVIKNVFGAQAELIYSFKESIKPDIAAVTVAKVTPVQIKPPVATQAAPEKKKSFMPSERQNFQKHKPKEKIILFDVSDEKWKTANVLLKYFPGTVQLLGDASHV